MSKTISPETLASLQGTLIGDILEAVQGGASGHISESVASDEKIVGEMNALEKALISLRDKCAATESGIVGHFQKPEVNPLDSENAQLRARLKTVRDRAKILQKLLWESIETRLAERRDDATTGWGIREGGHVVLVFGDHGREPGDLLGLLMGMGMMGCGE